MNFSEIQQRTQPNIVAHALTCLPNIGACTGDFAMRILSWGILSFSIFGTHKIWGFFSEGILSREILSTGEFFPGGFSHGGFCRRSQSLGDMIYNIASLVN